MKKRLFQTLGLLTALLLAVSGCGSQASGKSGGAPDAASLQALVANDGEVEYIFAQAGLPVDGKKPLKSAEGILYFPVQSDKYKSMTELEKLVRDTYAYDEVINRVLATAGASNELLYADLDGVLCRSASPVIAGSVTTADAKSVKLGQVQKGEDGSSYLDFTVSETVGEETVGTTQLRAVQTQSGWRLAETRFSVMHTENDPEMTQPEGSMRETAQAFLDALAARDAKQVEYLSTQYDFGFSGHVYNFDFVADCGVTAAEVTDMLSENEYGGEYRARITAEGGNGAFAPGSASYILRVAPNSTEDGQVMGSPLYISGLWPEGKTPYRRLSFEEQTNHALNQIKRLIELHGMVQFNSPRDLSNSALTEYLLYQMWVVNPETAEQGYTLEQVQEMGQKLLGISGFTPDNAFYSSELERYVMWGRGFSPPNYALVQTGEADGVITIDALVYSDPLQLMPTARVVYTVKNNWNGTYELVSGVATDV